MTETDGPGAGRRGVMLILSSPSGAGKTTLTRMLLGLRDRSLELSVSATTRPRRTSEADGVHYHFVTPRAFEAMRDGGDLLEWAEVHGNLYGTPKAPVLAALAAGRDVLFDVDWQGARQLVANGGRDAVTVFILPPSMAELEARLERRAEDPPEVIGRRLRNAREEISHWRDYDHVLVNDDVQEAFRGLLAILGAEHSRPARTKDALAAFVEGLMGRGGTAAA